MRHARTRRGGFTLLEVMITLVIFVAILGLPTTLLTSSAELYHRSSVAAGLSEKGRVVLGDITDHLARTSSTSCVPPVPPLPNVTVSDVRYEPIIGYAGGTFPAPGLKERIVLEYSAEDPDDGLDNDGDGRIDEGVAVLIVDPGTINEQRRILTDDVAEWGAGEIPGNGVDDNGNGWVDERGLAFGFSGERVTVLLTLERVDPKEGLILHSVERVIAFRNKEP